MNISKRSQSHLCPFHIIAYKQRLVAMVERFDADLCLCLVRQGQEWSVLGEEGPFSTKWQPALVDLTVDQTLANPRGSRFLAEIVRNGVCGSVISALLENGSFIFVAAKRLHQRVYTEDDVRALVQFMEAFERAQR